MQLHRDRERFEEAGVELAVIGQGRENDAARFRRRHKLELRILVDPDRRTYKAAGTKKATLSELVGPGVVARGVVRGARARQVQGRIVGHPAQLGGVIVVTPDGSVPYAYLAEDAGDNPPNEEVLAAAREAVRASS